MTKKEIRDLMIEKRKNQNSEEKMIRDQHIIDQIISYQKFIQAKTVALFYPMGKEINLLKLLKQDKIFLFPRVNGKNLDFYIYTKDMVFEKSRFGVLEPKADQVYTDKIDFMVVPALCISKACHRVGYGGGYYDRYIQNHKIDFTLGVIYDFQELNHFEISSFDQKLNHYIKGSL
ncbi:MAG: 5-formyltetrahydrofolate cyclo-ligase [Acholeplasmataceae bacterium]|nr:5-formyltetrahydrofolate cyclo-ligase [Acholeplasmataceae bacterium]